jgi:hypothetical protein
MSKRIFICFAVVVFCVPILHLLQSGSKESHLEIQKSNSDCSSRSSYAGNREVFMDCIAEWNQVETLAAPYMDGKNNMYELVHKWNTSIIERLNHVAHHHPFDYIGNKRKATTTLYYVGGNKVAKVANDYRNLFHFDSYHVFEPMKPFLSTLKQSFVDTGGLSNVHFYQYGLDYADEFLTIRNDKYKMAIRRGDKCAPNEKDCVLLELKSAAETFLSIGVLNNVNNTRNILYTNCEGCEIGSLERLIETGLVKYFDYIHFATHREPLRELIPRVCRIREYLSRTHTFLWGFPYAQERWMRKANTAQD